MKLMKLAVLLFTLSWCEGYKILCVFPVPSRSHNHLGMGIVGALLKAGHEVTFATPFPAKNPQKGLTVIDISELQKLTMAVDPLAGTMDISEIKMFARNISVGAITNPEVQRVLTQEKFDAVVTEWFFSDIQAGFAAVQKVPWILLSGTVMHAPIEAIIDDVRTAPLIPNLMLNYPIPMNLWQRMANTFMISMMCFSNWLETSTNEEIYKNMFGPIAKKRGVELPLYSEAVYDISVLLVNSHPSLAPAQSLPPNAVDIAGYHISEHHSPLPKDLQDLLDGSTKGVVYFSMGSVVKSSALPQSTRQDLIRILAALPYTVLWKFEEAIEGLPKNVHVRAWMPQPAILEHPNTKLFITHGGMLSTLEAMHFGVPLLAIPVFGDQPGNADRAVRAGYALKVPFSTGMGPELKLALDEILNNNSYYNKAKYLSKIFRNRLVPPAKVLAHYVELAIETKGAHHLRSQTRHYAWYQRWMLDQLAVVLLAPLLALSALKFVVKRACGASRKASGKLKKK